MGAAGATSSIPEVPWAPCALPRAQKPTRDPALTGSDVQLHEEYGRRGAYICDGSLSLNFRGSLCMSCILVASSGSPSAPSSVTLGSAPQCNPSQAFVPRTTSPTPCWGQLLKPGCAQKSPGGLVRPDPRPYLPRGDCNCHLFPGDAVGPWVKAPASAGDPDPHCVVWPLALPPRALSLVSAKGRGRVPPLEGTDHKDQRWHALRDGPAAR